MNSSILLSALFLSASAQAMTPAECENKAYEAAKAVSMTLGSDGCNDVGSYPYREETKINTNGKCEFTLSYQEGGTQVQCEGVLIPGPFYLIRKPLAIRKFKRACVKVGFSERIYKKADGDRTVTCIE